jgi:hypothetical protein
MARMQALRVPVVRIAKLIGAPASKARQECAPCPWLPRRIHSDDTKSRGAVRSLEDQRAGLAASGIAQMLRRKRKPRTSGA